MSRLKQPPGTIWGDGGVLHFVRHGQYDNADAGSGKLTVLGKKQALRLARYFEGVTITRIASSDAIRAFETAEILAKALAVTSTRRYRLLREVLPTRLPGMQISLTKRRDGSARIERILERFFKTTRQTQHEILVCHGNLIRSLVLRVVSGRADGWHRLMTHHTSVTSFLVSTRGIEVVAVNAQGHLPLRMRSDR